MGVDSIAKYDHIKVGDTFGNWIVVGEVVVDGTAKIPCKCKCELEIMVDAYNLSKGKSRSCKACSLPRNASKNPAWKGYEEIPASWFRRFKSYSKIEFKIAIEDIWRLYLTQDRKCALTGLPIGFANENTRGNRHSGLKCTASIDRINSNEGYTEENIQLVHKDVNIMKNKYDQEYYVKICQLVVDNKNKQN